jgi:hypothetical protein
MSAFKYVGAALLMLISISPAGAGDFGKADRLICAVVDVLECLPAAGCEETTAKEINLPQFFKINIKKKHIKGIRAGGTEAETPISSLQHLDGKLILQGAQDGQKDVRDGVGWTLAIMENTGEMVMTASGDMVGFVVFGACTYPDK